MEDTNGIDIQIDRKGNQPRQAVIHCSGDKVSQWLQELFPCLKELIGVSVRCKLVLESASSPSVPRITCNDQLDDNAILSKFTEVFRKCHSSDCNQSPAQEMDRRKNDVVETNHLVETKRPSTGDKTSRCAILYQCIASYVASFVPSYLYSY